MAHPYRPKLSFPVLLSFVFLVLTDSSAFAIKTVKVSTLPSSGIAPLTVTLVCVVASNTSPPINYSMDFGDGSNPEKVETTAYSHIFTHTYQAGYFKPICTVQKQLGLSTPSDPARLIVAKWRFETGGQVDSSPAIGPDGTVYVGSDDGNLYAIEPETGTEVWRYPAGGTVRSSPAVNSDGTIYFGATNTLLAVNARGALKWSFNAGDYVLSSPAVSSDGRMVYVGASNGVLYAINATGAMKWQFQTGGQIVSSPAIGYDGVEDVVYVGSNDRHVYAVAADNGALKWVFQTQAEVYGSPAIGPDGSVYVGECKTGTANTYDFYFFCLNVDGSKRWQKNGGTGFYSSPAIGSNGSVYVGLWDGYLFALNNSGGLAWSVLTSPPAEINSSPAVGANDVAYVGCNDGNFYAFQDKSNSQSSSLLSSASDNSQDWVFQTGDVIQSSPVIDAKGTLYFGSRDHYVYAINPGNLTPAKSAWPMFRGNAAHTGAAGAISIPLVISSVPEQGDASVDVNSAARVQVNFSPQVQTSQVDIGSFKLEQETTSNGQIVRTPVEGFAILDYGRFNGSGYHVIAVFERLDKNKPLAYNTTYDGSIQYASVPPADGATASFDKTFSWSFTTQSDPSAVVSQPGTGGHPGCFITTILD